jgi:hypothetical protein
LTVGTVPVEQDPLHRRRDRLQVTATVEGPSEPGEQGTHRIGESVTVERLLRYRVDSGLLTECWLYEADQATVDRYWR